MKWDASQMGAWSSDANVTWSPSIAREFAAVRKSLMRIEHDLSDDCLCSTCRQVRKIHRKYA